MSTKGAGRGTPYSHIIQDDLAQLVKPDRLPDGFSWDNIEDIAFMLAKAWMLGFKYAKGERHG